MLVLPDKQTVYFDVDDTLVMWDFGAYPELQHLKVEFTTPSGITQMLIPHEKHIESLKKHKQHGDVIIVWSAGGSKWAQTVVETLGLTSYVDVVLSKPYWFYDDLMPQDFMPLINRVYIPFAG